ncbi:MAG TPA: response regulator [Nitrososphaerales archaeon]|nr:response regulator [Nitrososphaerales archaeon]
MSSNNGNTALLVVDDDATIRETLRAVLEREGYCVETAKDGSEAIEKSNVKLFELALVDMRLPDMMGTDVLGRLRQTTPKMRKIILTGYPSMNNAIDSVNEGADCYILKPVDTEVVIASIKEQLQRRAEEAEYSVKKVTEYIVTRGMELDRKYDSNHSQAPGPSSPS